MRVLTTSFMFIILLSLSSFAFAQSDDEIKCYPEDISSQELREWKQQNQSRKK